LQETSAFAQLHGLDEVNERGKQLLNRPAPLWSRSASPPGEPSQAGIWAQPRTRWRPLSARLSRNCRQPRHLYFKVRGRWI